MREQLDRAKENTRMDASLAMLPVWFMTYRRGKRVSYGVANGKTGAFSMDLPVDTKAFWLSTLCLTIPIFLAALIFLPALSIKILNMIAWFISIVAMAVAGMKQATRYERNKQIRQKNKFSLFAFSLEKTAVSPGLIFFLVFLLLFLAISSDALRVVAENFNLVLWIPTVALFLFELVRGRRGINLAVLLGAFSSGVTAFVLWLDPPQDYYYYGSALFAVLALVGVVYLIVGIQREFSERKLPFYERGEMK